jgi:hypothetical protein
MVRDFLKDACSFSALSGFLQSCRHLLMDSPGFKKMPFEIFCEILYSGV